MDGVTNCGGPFDSTGVATSSFVGVVFHGIIIAFLQGKNKGGEAEPFCPAESRLTALPMEATFNREFN
jgi:hypothetical protein